MRELRQAEFDGFTIELTLYEARKMSHSGACDDDVSAFLLSPSGEEILEYLEPYADAVRSELEGFGCWDPEDLADDSDNARRIIWIAAGNIVDAEECKP